MDPARLQGVVFLGGEARGAPPCLEVATAFNARAQQRGDDADALDKLLTETPASLRALVALLGTWWRVVLETWHEEWT